MADPNLCDVTEPPFKNPESAPGLQFLCSIAACCRARQLVAGVDVRLESLVYVVV